MMGQRLKQFRSAMLARLTDDDRGYVKGLLTEKEQELFDRLSIPDQCHAIRVARTIEQLLTADCDAGLAVRAGLLHDIGRTGRDMGTGGKVISVLARAAMPGLSRRLARYGRKKTGLRHILYVYYRHPQIGAGMLREIGLLREAAIVERHHCAPSPDDSPELCLLRRADEMN